MKLLAIVFATVLLSSTSAFQPVSRFLLGNNHLHRHDDNPCRRESSKLNTQFWWDSLPGRPKYTKKKSDDKIVKATEDLEKILNDAKASMEEANVVLQEADAVLSKKVAPSPATTSDQKDWSSMTVPMLKQALRDRGLTVSGKKAELVDRLETFEAETSDKAADDAEEEEQEEDVEPEAEAEAEEEDDEWEREETEEDDTTPAVEEMDYTKLTVPMLKIEMRRKGLKIGKGNKKGMIAKLQAASGTTPPISKEEEEEEEPAPVSDPEPPQPESSSTTTADQKDWSSMTVPILKQALKDRGLTVSGKKADLVDRLETFEAAKSDETEDDAEEEEEEEEFEFDEEDDEWEWEEIEEEEDDDDEWEWEWEEEEDDDDDGTSAVDKVDYTKFTTVMLKIELRRKGLPQSGSKKVMIERLQNA